MYARLLEKRKAKAERRNATKKGKAKKNQRLTRSKKEQQQLYSYSMKHYREHVDNAHSAVDWLRYGIDIFKLLESRRREFKQIRDWLVTSCYIIKCV